MEEKVGENMQTKYIRKWNTWEHGYDPYSKIKRPAILENNLLCGFPSDSKNVGLAIHVK